MAEEQPVEPVVTTETVTTETVTEAPASEPVEDVSLEHARIQADKEVTIAAIAAEAQVETAQAHAASTEFETWMRTEMEATRATISSLADRMTAVEAITLLSSRPPSPEPPPNPPEEQEPAESVEAGRQEAEPEPKERKRFHRWT